MNEFIKNQLVHDLLLEALKVDHIPDRCAWGTNWESIRLPEGYEKPPKEEFEAKLQELIDAQRGLPPPTLSQRVKAMFGFRRAAVRVE